MHLIVIRAFTGYVRGDVISDPATVSRILTSHHAGFVIRVAAKSIGKN
jgi:hypothetical protein